MAQTKRIILREERSFVEVCGWNIRPSLDAGGTRLIDPMLTQAEKGRVFARCMSVTARSLSQSVDVGTRAVAHLALKPGHTSAAMAFLRRAE